MKTKFTLIASQIELRRDVIFSMGQNPTGKVRQVVDAERRKTSLANGKRQSALSHLATKRKQRLHKRRRAQNHMLQSTLLAKTSIKQQYDTGAVRLRESRGSTGFLLRLRPTPTPRRPI